MEPLARMLSDYRDSRGWTNADIVRRTGLARQHLQQVITRKTPYGDRPPTRALLETLASLPGLRIEDVERAVARSMGYTIGYVVEADNNTVPGMPDDVRAFAKAAVGEDEETVKAAMRAAWEVVETAQRVRPKRRR